MSFKTVHFFDPVNGTGVRVTPWHFLLLELLLPVNRPEASRWVVVLPLTFVVPVKRPEASRYWVVALVEPLPVRLSALPAIRPLASRKVVRERVGDLPWVCAEPVILPLASRYWVCVVMPPLVLVVAVPMILPEASRITARSVPPDCFWRSMVWTIRPEASRTTSRQLWAGELATSAQESSRAGSRIAFMGG
jgi:hypothetical protein